MNTLLNKYINMFEQDNRHTDSLDFTRIKKKNLTEIKKKNTSCHYFHCFYSPHLRSPLLQQTTGDDRWVKSHTRCSKNLPGRVESFHRLLLVAPARGVFIFTGSPTAGHGALHVAGDDVPQGFSHLGVFCCWHPCACCSWNKQRAIQ